MAGDGPPGGGRIFLSGGEGTRLPAHRRARLGLSRTFQVTNLFAGLSVLDNVRLAAQAGQPGRWRRLGPVRPGDRVGLAAMEALERAGIAARAGDRVAELSHGEQRQLEVALALATSPKLLLLDEPAAGLSAGERSRLRELLGSLPDSLPLLLIEHDMTLALSLADEVLRGLSLTVAAGELLALLGRNGMGKTTLLRAVCGLRPPTPTGGSVRVAGEEVTGLPAYQVARRGVSLVPQGRRVFGSLTVEENLRIAARPGDWDLDGVSSRGGGGAVAWPAPRPPPRDAPPILRELVGLEKGAR